MSYTESISSPLRYFRDRLERPLDVLRQRSLFSENERSARVCQKTLFLSMFCELYHLEKSSFGCSTRLFDERLHFLLFLVKTLTQQCFRLLPE